METFHHQSVLLRESVDALCVRPDGVYVDGTAGGGGHSAAIARLLASGRLIALDTDPDAVAAASARLAPFGAHAQVVRANFRNMKAVLSGMGVDGADGILLDLGVSSHQFDAPLRGFSYRADAPLDMRMSQQGPGAKELLAGAPYEELVRILREYGEERFATRIAAAIVRTREQAPIETTGQLAALVRDAYPAPARREGHPARKTFQALRMAVNGELDALSALLDDALSLLRPDGRLCIITFHSLEDRMVKQRFLSWAQGCICPPDFPVCVCGRTPQAAIPFRRGVTPSPEELAENSRSRSARLRAVRKLREEERQKAAAR